MKKIGIIGGGAAGYFLAANLTRSLGESAILFEQSKQPLQKVAVSGGGRCNVSHACFDPVELVEFYPRGNKELLSVFHRFQPGDTMEWFESRGVRLKIEDDNRIFPISDSSQTIINCFQEEVVKNKVQVQLGEGIQSVRKLENGFKIFTRDSSCEVENLIITTGSSPKSWKLIKELGHSIIPPVPSLFTFNCKDKRIKDLMGIGFNEAGVILPESGFESQGSLLITHWGFSGPAILKLSAWAAISLNQNNYKFSARFNFVNQEKEEVISLLEEQKFTQPNKTVLKNNPFPFPKRFWHSILEYLQIPHGITYSNLSKKSIHAIASELTEGVYEINGKSTFKDEFVTAGGVNLKEINFKTMESKLVPNLYFAGEVLNIDAITGGFNFQACWSEAYIIADRLKDLYSG